MTTTRFAPSPNGYLHLGHAHAALFAQAQGTRFLLRIEDIDRGRARSEFETAIFEDLAWLGLDWEWPVRRQSEHFDDYAAALDCLAAAGLLYPCFCTRKEIQAEIARSPAAPHGPEGALYPGICRGLDPALAAERRAQGDGFALRLDMAEAQRRTGPLEWRDRGRGLVIAHPEAHGDIVLARKDVPTSYHLSVTLDDHLQGVDLVTRGEDLFAASDIHCLLQALLGLDVPEWHHHGLIRDPAGRRLAKREGAPTLRRLRADGVTPEEVRATVENAEGQSGSG